MIQVTDPGPQSLHLDPHPSITHLPGRMFEQHTKQTLVNVNFVNIFGKEITFVVVISVNKI